MSLGGQCIDEEDPGFDDEYEDSLDGDLPFPGFLPVSLGMFTQESKFRFACLTAIQNPYPFRNKRSCHTAIAVTIVISISDTFRVRVL